uniref:Transmembrane and coiled-coil domain family 1 n=2 Tax=Sinocyclocheilus rhinocerous TaxID=307959 RepID=A0A673HAE0_9TELE
MQQGLRDVGARVITGLSEGVVDSVKGGLSSFSHVTHSAAGAVASKPREIASLIRHRFGSADNISVLKDGPEDAEDGVAAAGRSLGSAGGHLQSSPKFGSDEDCSSATSGSVGANSVTGAPGGPPSSRGNTLERGHSGSLDMLLQELQELRDAQTRLEETTQARNVFEKKNQKSAASIAQLQRKLEHYHRRLREVEHSGVQRQPKDMLRDMQQGLRDVGARVITGLSEGVVDSVKGGLSSFSHVTHSAAGAVASKPREIASLIRHRFGSADNISVLKDGPEDAEDGVAAAGRSLGSSSPKFGSDEDCSSATSGSVGANSVTGAPGGPPSSRGNTLERGHSGSLDMLLQELQELRDAQTRLEETFFSKNEYVIIVTHNDRVEGKQNAILEQHYSNIRLYYDFYKEFRCVCVCVCQEALEACQTRVSKMELQQQQQQVGQLEGLENATARTLMGKLINVLLALMAVLLVFVSTVANCVVPLMKTRSRSVSSLLVFLLFAVLWRNWDAFSGHTSRLLHVPR